MISKINALCYAYEAYGHARALKDREAQAEAAREMARLRAEIKRELKHARTYGGCVSFDGGVCRVVSTAR